MKILIAGITGVILLAGLSACAKLPQGTTIVPVAGVTPEINADQYWWYCRFKVNWPEDVEPQMVVDLMLAHAVVGPVLQLHRQGIPYWRFHRRVAGRCRPSIQFYFLFRSGYRCSCNDRYA